MARSTFQSKNVQNTPFSEHFWKVICSKVNGVVARNTFQSQKCKKLTGSEHFWTLSCRFAWQAAGAKGLRTLSKVSRMWWFWRSFKSVGRRGTFEEDLQRCILRGGRSTRDMFIRDVRRSGLISWEGLHFGASDLQFWSDVFAWQVQHFVWPGFTFSWQAQYFKQMEWKNRKTHWYEAVGSALTQLSIFEGSLGVSQNCFVFDVVNLEN